jgi:hypothetical protein
MLKWTVEDFQDLMRFRWYVDQGTHIFETSSSNMNVAMHRYLLDFPEGRVVDHVRWNRLDNKKHMLRACTVAENNRNMSYRRIIR